MPILILTITTVVVASLILFFLFRVLGNYKPSKKKVQEDLKKMKEELEPMAENLVPLSKEELELFSFGQIDQVARKRVTAVAKGIFTTIYDEPIVAYSYKKYISSGVDAILYARSANHEFAYRIKNGEVKIVIDNELVGIMKQNGVVYGKSKKRMIARINREGNELIPILVKDREVGNIVKALPPGTSTPLNDRAFSFIKEDIDDEEKKIFISLAILELVNRGNEPSD